MITHIPGTDVPLTVIRPTGARPPLRDDSEARQRRGLLAKIHIAKQDLGLTQDEYELILNGFKVASAAELTIPQLERLVTYLGKLGWRPVRLRRRRAADDEIRLAPLRRRCVEIAKSLLYCHPDQTFLGRIESDEDYERIERWCEFQYGVQWSRPRPPFLAMRSLAGGHP